MPPRFVTFQVLYTPLNALERYPYALLRKRYIEILGRDAFIPR